MHPTENQNIVDKIDQLNKIDNNQRCTYDLILNMIHFCTNLYLL